MSTIDDILKKYWGYSDFRPLQREVIESVICGHDTVALLPTGGGKSLTYQVPAMAMDGVCIVITPLIALMKDQVDALRRRGVSAVAIHSAMSAREIDIALDNCVYGGVKMLYIAPERIGTSIFRARVRKMEVSFIAVDEAHCISQWGYDFRPSYLRICELRDMIPDIPMLAVTATATGEVLEDIKRHLRMDDPLVVRGSFARPNINFVVRHGDDKFEQMLRVIRSVDGSGIVYARTRKATEDIAAMLRAQGIAADFYHAGIGYRTRGAKQEEWLRGTMRVVVATNAFGMGIDKADVRFVIHHQMPDSLEAYYQEAGRAGRDGERSYAVLLFSGLDTTAASRRIAMAFPPPDQIRTVYETLFNHVGVSIGGGKGQIFDFDLMAFASKYKIFALTAYNALKILELNGYIVLTDLLDNPTRIMFRTSREELYRLQVERTDLESFIKIVLRLYTGLFTEFVAIDEGYIARMSGYTETRVIELLYQLSIMRVIRYIPRRSSPLLILEEERLPTCDVVIAPETYHRRREVAELRVSAIAEYVENGTQCRSVMLQNYFDEHDAQPCGVCDVCRSRHSSELFTTADAFAGVEQLLIDRLAAVGVERGATLRALIAAIPGRSMVVLTALRRLIASGRAVQGSDGAIRLKV